MNLKEALKGKLTERELGLLVKSYDQVGGLAVIEIPEALEKKERIIAETLLGLHKNIVSVAKKVGLHYGKFRRQRLKMLAGIRKKTALHMESGVRMYVNYEQAYFSPRLSNDRLEVCDLVKKDEKVLVMFSGVAPQPLVLSKHTEAKWIDAVEFNPLGHALAQKNIALNKVENIGLYCGDVRDVVPKLGVYDRITMCLPKDAISFLDVAFGACKRGGVVHCYAFWHKDEFDLEKKKLKAYMKELGLHGRLLRVVRCGAHKPRVYRVRIDIKKQ